MQFLKIFSITINTQYQLQIYNVLVRHLFYFIIIIFSLKNIGLVCSPVIVHYILNSSSTRIVKQIKNKAVFFQCTAKIIWGGFFPFFFLMHIFRPILDTLNETLVAMGPGVYIFKFPRLPLCIPEFQSQQNKKSNLSLNDSKVRY